MSFWKGFTGTRTGAHFAARSVRFEHGRVLPGVQAAHWGPAVYTGSCSTGSMSTVYQGTAKWPTRCDVIFAFVTSQSSELTCAPARVFLFFH